MNICSTPTGPSSISLASGSRCENVYETRSNKPFGSSKHLARETQSKGEAAQRSGRNVVDDANQLPPLQLGAIAREHDFFGYRQAVGGASHLKRALYRYKLNPGPWDVTVTNLPECALVSESQWHLRFRKG